MKSKNINFIILIILCLLLLGCGNKGDLYLPEKQEESSQKDNP